MEGSGELQGAAAPLSSSAGRIVRDRLAEEAFTGENHPFQAGTGKGVGCIPYKTSTIPCNSAWRNLVTPKSCFSLRDGHSEQFPISSFSSSNIPFPSAIPLSNAPIFWLKKKKLLFLRVKDHSLKIYV